MSEDRKFKPPVAWLGGRDLLANLKKFALFAAYQGKLDPRDWMQGEIFPLGEQHDPHYFDQFVRVGPDGKEEFWFDYFADCGDGMTAGYSLVFLCMSNLRLAADGTVDLDKTVNAPAASSESLPRGAFLFVGGDTSYHVADYPNLGLRFQKIFEWAFKDLPGSPETKAQMWQEENRRPIFGVPGNHDYYDMIDGFNRQFRKSVTREVSFLNFAGKDLQPQLRLWVFKRFQSATYVAVRMPFDWWFWGVDSELDTVDIRQQEFFKRSYLQALRHDVRRRLIGKLGKEPSNEEIRAELPSRERYDFGDRWPMPKKLIVATSEPTTVEGRRSEVDDKTSRAFSFLNLKRPFLYLGIDPADPRAHEQAAEAKKNLSDFSCRLDISGDTHHYARYWGDDTRNIGNRWSSPNYASVVSGGGGASMSPTQTDLSQVLNQAVYPDKDLSRQAIYARLFNPWTVIRGGNVWVAGFLIAFVVYLELSSPFDHYSFTSALLDRLPLISAPHDVSLTNAAYGFGHALKLVWFLILSIAGVTGSILYARSLFDRLTGTYDWAQEQKINLEQHKPLNEQLDQKYNQLLDEIKDQTPGRAQPWPLILLSLVTFVIVVAFSVFEVWFYAAKGSPGRLTYDGGIVAFSLATIIIVISGIVLPRRQFKVFQKVIADGASSAEDKIKSVSELVVTPIADYVLFWALLILGAVHLTAVFYEFLFPLTYGSMPFFGNSVCVLLSLTVAGIAMVGATYYSKWLFDQAYRIKVNFYSYVPVYGLSALAIASLLAAIRLTGIHEARFLLSDILFTFLAIAVLGGCLYLALAVGNKVHNLRRFLIFGFLGAWHGLLQLLIPFLLVWLGGWRSIGAALLIVLGVSILMIVLVKRIPTKRITALINRPVLASLWFLFGIVMLLLPLVIHKSHIDPGLFSGRIYTTFQTFFAATVAGLVGLVMSCLWLGWYFGVALAFDGHANEAGSTARIEDYKQFIRFRLTEDTLTGFVIGVDHPKEFLTGVDQPQKKGADFHPRLVDKFTLTCKPLK
jgi:hypothetical protein